MMNHFSSSKFSIKQVLAGVSRSELLIWSLALLAMVLFLTIGDESSYVNFLASNDGHLSDIEYNSYLYHHVMTLLIFGSPLFLMSRFRISQMGFDLFKLGDWHWGLPWTLVACVVMILPTWFSSSDSQFIQEYPLAHGMFDNVGWLLLFFISYALYYVGWESFFRGFLGFGLIHVGYRPFVAMMIQVSLSCIIHIGKPDMELIGAIGGGVIFALLAYRSGSLFWPFLFHLFLGLLNTWFCWLNQPFNLLAS